MNPEDLALYRQLGAWAEELTGYPMVSGCEEFLYEPDTPLHGDLTDYAYHQRGAVAYVVELWDLFKQVGFERKKRFVDNYAQLTRGGHARIAVWDRDKNAGRVVRPWRAFKHPQLGDVEVGGIDPRVGMWNPPPEEMPRDLHATKRRTTCGRRRSRRRWRWTRSRPRRCRRSSRASPSPSPTTATCPRTCSHRRRRSRTTSRCGPTFAAPAASSPIPTSRIARSATSTAGAAASSTAPARSTTRAPAARPARARCRGSCAAAVWSACASARAASAGRRATIEIG